MSPQLFDVVIVVGERLVVGRMGEGGLNYD